MEDIECLKEVESLKEVLSKCCHHYILNSDYNFELNKKRKIIELLFEINQKLFLLKMILKSEV